MEGAVFYSDSHNDLPLLQTVDKPVAVDPDERLKSEALRNGWDIISLRN
jgi:phosphoserine phosphatase